MPLHKPVPVPTVGPQCVLDTSALLAHYKGEPGADVVAGLIDGAIMSVINLQEFVFVVDRGGDGLTAVMNYLIAGLKPAPVDLNTSLAAGRIGRGITGKNAVGLGDRTCLATAKALGLVAVGADTPWLDLPDPNNALPLMAMIRERQIVT